MTESEKFFLELVRTGYLVAKEDGSVFNAKTRRFIGILKCPGYAKLSVKDFSTGKIRHIQTHRFIYLVFKGEIPYGMQVNHIDGNKKNSSLLNLELTTPGQNMLHAHRTGLVVRLEGEANGNSKFTHKEVLHYRNLYAMKRITVVGLAKEKNVLMATTSNLLRKLTYGAVAE